MIRDNSDEQQNRNTGLTGRVVSSPVVMVAKPTQPKGDDRPMHIFPVLISAIRRRWRIAVPLGLCLAVVGGFTGWKIFSTKFTASSFLRIDAENSPLIFKTADAASGPGADFKLYKNTNQQLLLTPFVLSTALRDSQVSSQVEISSQENPIEWLQANLKVTFPGDSEIMRVSLETKSPTACVPIVNGVVNAFMQEVVQNERNDRLSRLNSLELVHNEAETKVRTKRGELKNLASALGTSDSESLTVVQQSALQQYGNMTEKLSQIQFSLMQAEGDLKIAEEFERAQKEAGLQLKFDKEVDSLEKSTKAAKLALAERSPDVIRMEEELALLRSKLKSWDNVYGVTHPSIQKLKGEIEEKSRLLENRKSEVKQRALLEVDNPQPNPKTGVNYDYAALSMRKEILVNQEKILQNMVNELAQETKQIGRSSIDVELMRSEISGLEGVLSRVGDEIERTTIELKTASRIKLLSPAVTAIPSDSSKRLTRALALSLFGLVAPMGLILVWDLSRRLVSTGEGASETLSLPTMGMIPRVARNPLQRQTQEFQSDTDQAQAELKEVLDDLASMMLHSSGIGDRQVFMISSAMPAEGKSTVACQLAQGLARAGRSVVLVDFDLRRPSLHRYLELPLKPGVAESLQGDLSFEAAVQRTDQANLSVMTAGDWSGNLQERCTSGRVHELFAFLRGSFDLVLIDSSPILPVHDSRVIGKFADGVILTLVRDKSRLPLAARACEILKSYGVSVLGTIIIGMSARAYPNYYSPKDRKSKRLLEAN